MSLRRLLAAALDPAHILCAQGLLPDPWQREVLLCRDRNLLLCCSRGAGKSRVTSALALHTALFHPESLVLLVSRSQRQSVELFRYVKQGYRALGRPVATVKNSETQLELSNGSRLVALPGREETIRGFQGVALLILDEAARIPDTLYSSVRPMVGVSRGRTICLSTPFGQQGFFYRAWAEQGDLWRRFEVPWQRCPRLTPEFISEERRQFGDGWVAQEYECSFSSCEGLVYPQFEQAVVSEWPATLSGRRVGGIDWGFRNPFAAVWGVLDRHDVLWIEGERYQTQTALHEHAAALPRGVQWFADPSGATEIQEFRSAGLVVRPANNDIRAGIAAVTARLTTDRLKINAKRCPNLLAEARLYRYSKGAERLLVSENPVDEHNHALGALRYLIAQLDARFVARARRQEAEEAEPKERVRNRLRDEELWRG